MFPISLEEKILNSLSIRSQLTPENQFQLNRLRLGREGEEACYHFLQAYGKAEWELFHDISFDLHDTPYQIDFILLTYNCLYVIEVKHYHADVKVQQSNVYYNQKELIHNPYAQIRKNYLAISSYCQGLKLDLPMDYFLFFIHPDYSCELDDESQKIFDRPRCRQFLEQLKESELDQPNLDFTQLSAYIGSMKSSQTFHSKIKIPSSLKNGIYCPSCQSFNQQVTKFKVYCLACGHTVDKASALRHIIDEWCMLYHDQAMSCSAIYDFAGGSFSKDYIRFHLKRLRTKISTSYPRLYANPYSIIS